MGPVVLVDEQADGSVQMYAFWGMGRKESGGVRCAELAPADMYTIIDSQTRLPDRNATRKTLPDKEQNHGSTLFESSPQDREGLLCLYLFCE